MAKKIVILISFVLFFSCSSKKQDKDILRKATFSNPILKGFYPDPSICKVNGEYYMINSTFAYFPGIPIFKSSDLVNWEQIGNVLDRPEQLNLDGLGVSRGIFAPAIGYNNGIYYVISTLIDGGNNFVVSAKNPKEPWSKPTWLPEVEGIDPSLFFDKNGKSYIVYNSEAPDNSPEYDGHRTIKLYEFDLDELKVKGEAHIIINKGSKTEDKPIWIEGPHIYQENGYYYLMAAEGGTSDEHSEVVFRSKDVLGQYMSYENNPILTQRHLDNNRENPITSTGHADIIEDDNGNWWGVFLGCRPYDNEGHYNIGRETFMAPVTWKNDWPVFNLGSDVVKSNYPTPNNILKDNNKYSGKYEVLENFDSGTLGFEWLFLRTPNEKWYSISDGILEMETRPEHVSKPENPSFIGYRQQHIYGSVSTEMTFNTLVDNEKAGLIAFQNESHYYYLCKSIKSGKPVVQVFKSIEDKMMKIASKELTSNKSLELKIESKGSYYNFLYSEKDEDWKILKDSVDAKFLSTKVAGGFVGTIYAMYTTSLGITTENTAKYNWFEIENLDK